MFNECLIHLFDCTYLNMMCVCYTIYGSNQKDFRSFYMYLEVTFITLCVHVLCLLRFSLFKHVLCWKVGVWVFRDSLRNLWWLTRDLRDSRKFSQLISQLASHATQVASSSRSFCDSSRNSLTTRKNFRDSLSRETPKNNFLKGFSWKTCF